MSKKSTKLENMRQKYILKVLDDLIVFFDLPNLNLYDSLKYKHLAHFRKFSRDTIYILFVCTDSLSYKLSNIRFI